MEDHCHVYNGHLYSDECKLNAEQSLDEIERIYYLTESHMPCLRLNALKLLDYKQYFNDPNLYRTNRNVFDRGCDKKFNNDNWNFIQHMYRSLPSEWSIVQLTEAHTYRNLTHIFKNHDDNQESNCMYLTRFDCGKDAADPCCVKLLPPRYSKSKEIINIHGMVNTIIGESLKQPFKWYFGSGKDMLNDLLYYMSNHWLRCWRFLFFGHLRSRELNQGLSRLFDKFITNYHKMDLRTREILKKLLVNHNFLNDHEIDCVLFYLNIDGTCSLDFKQLISDVDKRCNLKNQKRFPVILILDEHLDKFPWESLSFMMYFEYTRIASLHFLYFLYKEHEPHVVNGYMQVKEIRGKAVVNPCKTLNKAEKRLKPFMESCLPEWQIIYSQAPVDEEFISLLQESTVFAYCGHNSGLQYVNVEQLNKARISAVVFIMGCNSVRLQFLGYHHEQIGPHHQYHLASCPCIVGSIWSIVDITADIFFSDVITMCFANESKFNWIEDLKDVWKENDYKFITDQTLPLTKRSNLLEAISYAKLRQKNGLTSVPFVSQGLPVEFLNIESD